MGVFLLSWDLGKGPFRLELILYLLKIGYGESFEVDLDSRISRGPAGTRTREYSLAALAYLVDKEKHNV